MNVNQWVQDFMLSNPQSAVVSPRNVERHTRVGAISHFGTFRHNEHDENIDQWEIIDTIGDGLCLIHSFLLLLSPVYCASQYKSLIARAFRMYIEPIMNTLDNTRYYGEPSERDIMRNVNAWLNDIIADKIAAFLGYGLIILRFMQTPRGINAPQISSTDNNGRPYLIIANKGGIVGEGDSGHHFEAVIRNELRISPPQLGDDIEPIKDALFNATMALMIISPQQRERQRCDSPRQRRSLENSISASEAKRLAKLFGVYEAGDTKAELCQKLQDIDEVDWYHRGIRQEGRKKRTHKKRRSRKAHKKSHQKRR